MKKFFGGLLVATGAVVLAVGVLAGAQVLLQNSNRRGRVRSVDLDETPAVPQSNAKVPAVTAGNVNSALAPKQDAERNFSIKRTKSEVGYVYWILEGYGKYKCFVLCDSWDEAVAHAKAKLAEVDGAESNTQVAVTSA